LAPKPEFALAGTMPGDHGLHPLLQDLRDDPRQRRIAIVEFSILDSKTHRPQDGPDEQTEILTIMYLEPLTDTADADQARAMAARARLNRPGQAQLGDDEHAGDASATA